MIFFDLILILLIIYRVLQNMNQLFNKLFPNISEKDKADIIINNLALLLFEILIFKILKLDKVRFSEL